MGRKGVFGGCISVALLSQLLLASPLFASSDSRAHGGHIHDHDDSKVQVASTLSNDERAEFRVWLPKWWAPEERDWGDVEPSTSSDIQYSGQDHEDRYAMENYFHGRDGLFYLEMGALNGQRWSNTLSFQKFKSSKGLLIEANPDTYKELVINRPHDICVNAAVCDTFQSVHFAKAEHNGDIAGIVEFMPKSFQMQWYPDPKSLSEAQLVPCLPFASIVKKLGVRRVDLWSLDVEGAELTVLKSVDWKSFSADVILVEADGHDQAKDQGVIDILKANGYVFDGLVDRNNWFHHESFSPSKSS